MKVNEILSQTQINTLTANSVCIVKIELNEKEGISIPYLAVPSYKIKEGKFIQKEDIGAVELNYVENTFLGDLPKDFIAIMYKNAYDTYITKSGIIENKDVMPMVAGIVDMCFMAMNIDREDWCYGPQRTIPFGEKELPLKDCITEITRSYIDRNKKIGWTDTSKKNLDILLRVVTELTTEYIAE